MSKELARAAAHWKRRALEAEASAQRLRDGIAAHQGAHAAWSGRQDGWEEATFAADYDLWSLLENS